MNTTLHPFLTTLGDGPYTFVGCYDLHEATDPTSAANFGNLTGWVKDAPRLKAGLGTCAHCGHAISNICIVRTGNGDLYGVGSDCIEHCDAPGIAKLVNATIQLKRKAQARARRNILAAAKWETERPAREAALAQARLEHDVALSAHKVTVDAKLANLPEYILPGLAEAAQGSDL